MVMNCIAFIHAIVHGMDAINYERSLSPNQEEGYIDCDQSLYSLYYFCVYIRAVRYVGLFAEYKNHK